MGVKAKQTPSFVLFWPLPHCLWFIDSLQADSPNQPPPPLARLSVPLGERIWKGEEEKEKKAGYKEMVPTPV